MARRTQDGMIYQGIVKSENAPAKSGPERVVPLVGSAQIVQDSRAERQCLDGAEFRSHVESIIHVESDRSPGAGREGGTDSDRAWEDHGGAFAVRVVDLGVEDVLGDARDPERLDRLEEHAKIESEAGTVTHARPVEIGVAVQILHGRARGSEGGHLHPIREVDATFTKIEFLV